MSCSLGPLHAPDGSAKFGFGQSVVLAAVYGPVGVRLSKEQLDRAFIDVEVKALVGGGGMNWTGIVFERVRIQPFRRD